ncbi:hypothetical protein BG006_001821 [Podila minutissima]|uniref:Uncharacterized protein n=1 Tax=Podila minutissima TaxID=64525 RepID=A0A9P5VGU1_9FUNG|nr:hypothetical protein BG006_001821 [Podila minutissima]
MIEFRILDAPGLNHTNGKGNAHADEITKRDDRRTAGCLEYYSNVLTSLHANIAFLYTLIDHIEITDQ